jgi:signal transduction histidine kinase
VSLRPAASLRARLLGAFAAVALAPALLVMAAWPWLAARLEGGAQQRLERRLEAVSAQLERLRTRATAQVEAIARDDLPAWREPAEGDVDLAAILARRHDLQMLEIVDGAGRLVSSAHWPAGFGLLDRDVLFRADPALRLERVSDDYGMAERLALMPAAEGQWRGAPVTLRGGFLLDSARAAELGALMQAQFAWRDRARGAWLGAPEAASVWPGPETTGAGRASVGGLSRRWAARAWSDDLWLVATEDTRESDELAASLRRALAGATALSLLAALLAARLLSERLARPVSALAEGARRVAQGDLGASVAVEGPRETVALASAFNEMTAALRESRARLVQAERVASWREMARRLAHELKNPLFPIQLSVETLRRAHERRDGQDFDALFREASATLLEELRGLTRIVDDFSRFARLPAPRPRPTSLADVVQQALALYRPQAGRVTIDVELDPGLGPVPVDAELLARALGNLVKNALEAMPEGGRLLVRTRAVARAAAIDVIDSGPGLDDEQRARLFTPYVTTKPGGTGLGLAIAQGIVSDHGGRIDVESAPGAGARFTIVLPRHAGEGT